MNSLDCNDADTGSTGETVVASSDNSTNVRVDSGCSKISYIDEQSISSDDDVYGDETDLLSVASTMHSAIGISTLALPSFPRPLSELYWCEPCATSFRVRGTNYTKDRKKQASLPSVFRLITVDVCEVAAPIRTGFCEHPKERVQEALRREKEGDNKDNLPPYIFCVNIIVPGPPWYHMVFYYAVNDMSLIKPYSPEDEAMNPLNRIASKFFFGPSDKIRDGMFKLVPRIVSGNVLVSKAVGTKPTIIGKKLVQSYVRSERYFEVIVDLGSSRIASNVVKLAKGYAKNLVVDMAFLLEGKSASCLPERILGTVRLMNVDFKSKLRFVDQP